MGARALRDGGGSAERYLVERTIGRGGMATVYLARDRALKRPVALKILAAHLAADDAFRARFLREARLAAQLGHPNVVQVYDVGEDERGPFIVMEYVEGETVAEDLRRRGRLPAAEVVEVGIQVCAALEAAHAEQLVHRDIKPQNILRRPDGQVKLADFGIARSLAATSHTEVGTVLGTAAYLAPEQARGEAVTAAADIYSLGVVLYELLTGRLPFGSAAPPRERAAATLPYELAPDVPAALEAVVMRCLALSPRERPASASELTRQLDASLGEPDTQLLPTRKSLPPTEVLPTTPLPHTRTLPDAGGHRGRTAQANRRRRLLAALIGTSLLVLAVLLAVVLADSGDGRRAANAPVTTAHKTTANSASATRTTAVTAPTTAANPPPTPAEPSAAEVTSQAEALMQAGNYEGALPLLQQAVAQLQGAGTPDEARADTDLAATLVQLGSCDGVIALLDRAEQLQGAQEQTDQLRGACSSPPGNGPGHGKKHKDGKGKND